MKIGWRKRGQRMWWIRRLPKSAAYVKFRAQSKSPRYVASNFDSLSSWRPTVSKNSDQEVDSRSRVRMRRYALYRVEFSQQWQYTRIFFYLAYITLDQDEHMLTHKKIGQFYYHISFLKNVWFTLVLCKIMEALGVNMAISWACPSSDWHKKLGISWAFCIYYTDWSCSRTICLWMYIMISITGTIISESWERLALPSRIGGGGGAGSTLAAWWCFRHVLGLWI